LHLTQVIVLSTRFGTGLDQMKVICFSQGTVATFHRRGGYIYNLMWCFFGILCTKITKIGSFFHRAI